MSEVNISDQSSLTTFMQDVESVVGIINQSIELEHNYTLTATYPKILCSNVGNSLVKLPPQEEPTFSVNKDMRERSYDSEITPSDYPHYFPDMSPLVNENILIGDKDETNMYDASEWRDWGDDVFDDWGFFYFYDPSLGKYYFPLISPQNLDDGVMSLQTFNVFDRTFTIRHGWATYGVFKFDISVADGEPFIFGAYGNMGFDSNGVVEHLTYPYTLVNDNKTLYYVKQCEDSDETEILYTYVVPKNASHTTISYDLYNDNGDTNSSLISKPVTNGLLVYFSKTLDKKTWVVSDIIATLD